MTNANDKRGKKHSGTTSHELVFSTRASHPCEKRNKRNKRRRVRSAQRERERERETNKLRTVTRSVNPEAARYTRSSRAVWIQSANISPRVSSSSSFRTLLSSESSSEDFLPSFTGTTVKLVGIFSPCEASVFLLICPSHPRPLLLCAGLFEQWFEVLSCAPISFTPARPCDQPASI